LSKYEYIIVTKESQLSLPRGKAIIINNNDRFTIT